MSGYSGPERDGGFVLVSVMWALVLLALIAIVTTTAFRGSHRALSRADQLAGAKVLVDGLAQLLAADIAVTRLFRFNGMAMRSGWPLACRHENATIVLTATNSVGLVDLNLADRATLKTVLLAAGVKTDKVEQLLDAIIDFRDPDNLTREGLPEDRIYRDRGVLHLPKNSPYEDVGELDQVAFMNSRILARIRAFLTVFSHERKVETEVSPPRLAAILSGRTISDRQIASRAAEASRKSRAVASSAYRLETRYRMFEIRVMAMRDNGVHAMRVAGVEIMPGTRDGYRLVYWNRATPFSHERLLARFPDLPSCFLPSRSSE